MAYLTESDLLRVLYQEQIDEIKRDDTTLVPKALQSAENEARSYLSRFDLPVLFSDAVVDDNLKDKVVDVAVWNLVKKGAPGIDTEIIKMSRDDAIKFFEKSQSGKADPEGWPLKPVALDGTHPADNILWTSERRRRNRM